MRLALAVERLRGRLRAEAGTGRWSRRHLATLHRVVHGPPGTTSDLAAAEYVRPQSMAQVVTALAEGGLVRRVPDPHDGRRLLIRATDLGREVLRAASATREAWLAEAIEHGLDPAEREALPLLIRVLGTLADFGRPTRPTPRRRPHAQGPRRGGG
ncbi:MarR family winged helix-turn-helix transcriptional regulator [Streptomyces hoynatensis]|uniref:MarR family winged helix-turn-helix transcriptional regulator n=1 Tax=Streptomyces hoynatensis TaxID=1141874 RepID=UPI001F4D6819|nr:MarR family transcriptional regulator [Streptomyces hoynatensis]